MKNLWVIAVLAAVSWLTGCTSLRDRESNSAAKAAGPQKVSWNGFALGEAGKGTISTEAFGNRVAVLLKDNRQLSARLYVERYPDVALAFLHSPPLAMTADVQFFIERTYEAQCAIGNNLSWDERRTFTSQAADPGLDEESVLKLCKANLSTPAELDADLLGGETLLKVNQPKEAAAAFRAGVNVAENRPYEAVELHLRYAESLRREGKSSPAKAEWLKAVELAAQLLSKPSPVNDPHLWEQIAGSRPIDSAWPSAIKPALMHATATTGLPLSEAVTDDGAVWAAIGCWRLDRNEVDAALKAFKRAETMTADLITRNLLQVWQAKSLVMANQTTTATALLVPLVEHPSPLVAGPAGAHLAAIKIQGGADRQGRNLLEHALQLPGAWAGRPDAEADMALALLIDGEETKGLAQLQTAQNQFATAGDLPGLLRCLRDEADYWTTKEKKDQVEKIRKRIGHIESTGSDS